MERYCKFYPVRVTHYNILIIFEVISLKYRYLPVPLKRVMNGGSKATRPQHKQTPPHHGYTLLPSKYITILMYCSFAYVFLQKE